MFLQVSDLCPELAADGPVVGPEDFEDFQPGLDTATSGMLRNVMCMMHCFPLVLDLCLEFAVHRSIVGLEDFMDFSPDYRDLEHAAQSPAHVLQTLA